MIDTIFARLLHNGNHVLWFSETADPDLGGKRDNDFRHLFEEEIENPEVANRGFYRTYCVDLEVSVLAVNAILQCKSLEEAELLLTTDRSHVDENEIDHFKLMADAFRRLQFMVQSWVEDLYRGALVADTLVQHVYRWLSSPEAKMHDPLLHRVVHLFMRMIFL